MSFNVEEGAQLAISTFGGLITEVPPSNVPESGSPDNQDVQFWPGEVGSRDGLQKVFATPFASGSLVGTVTYAKSYVDPVGVIRNLYLDSLGNLWVEDVTSTPGTYSLLATTTPGSYAKSVTAFGREYIAISDKLHGADVPLQYDGTNLDRVTQDGPGAPPSIANLVIAKSSLATSPAGNLVRSNNVVTAATATPHGLLVGYLAQITDQPADLIAGGGGPITINNQDFPGIATMECAGNHHLGAGMIVNIFNVQPIDVSGGITSISRQGQVVTVDTVNDHGLTAGAQVTINLVPDTTFNASFIVQQVNGAKSFSYIQADVDAVDASGTGQVLLTWPVPDAAGTFEVVAVPSLTAFQFRSPVSSNAVFPAANVSFGWNGSYFVKSVISATEFTYDQYGPDDTVTAVGTVTPQGQVAPGIHQMQVLFLTRQGYVTKPSPPVKFIADGGHYLRVTDIPIGPSNTQARILAFTGSRGASFYYIPVPAEVNGQRVSTATQIDDNTTTAVTLDFSDNTLFAALGINILGNNLPAQVILDGALGFGHFGSRLITYGQRNRIQNLLNMSFDGGYLPSDPTMPTGWIAAGSPAAPGGALTTSGHYGDAWAISGAGSIYQSFYLDAYGAPIGTPRTKYSARVWIKGTGTITLTISSVTASFTSSVTLTGTSTTGAWIEGNFSVTMPDTISSDMILSVSGTVAATVDEISIIYRDTPYLDKILYGSYVNNPEAFDGVTGKFGPANDTRKVMNFGMIRGTLFLLTRDPSGRLHGVLDNGVTEPVGWTVNEVATGGTVSAFALTVSQADDATGGGGEEWIAWAGIIGGKFAARIFGGDQPWKISQEIQPDFDAINPAAALTMWACNDPGSRVIYFGLPVGVATAPNLIYPVDYKNLDTAFQIGQAAPTYRGPGGKMNSGEYCRKWTRWNLTINGAALMYRQDTSQLLLSFFDGNGVDPIFDTSPFLGGCGNVFNLCPNKLTDDCFGAFHPYYTTYFFPSHQLEAVLGIGTGRKMLEFFQYLATGVGQLRVSFLCNALDNPWPLNCIRDLSLDPQFDIEHPGASATGQRIAFKFEGLPV